ncbi:LADA_0G14422g1_1 [Lachancea dasiensis]|uniref:Sensitive to high expression protein 9, mitochondrial n=1 Tax=Lachancea dasiensis TaxID=1072105 RepID=A0A1G4JW23_9SACH|nr:LADA_0G14422g1_1 [Lachancea dasiensis]
MIERRVFLHASKLSKHSFFHHSLYPIVVTRCYSGSNGFNNEPSKELPNKPRDKLFDPYWAALRVKWSDSRTKLKHYSTQFRKHADKAKVAIQEANRKLAMAEQAEKDSRLQFDTDMETRGRIEGLPSERERYRRRWAKKLELYFDSLQETIFTATRALNDVTGYSSIQKLRTSIEMMEVQLEAAKGQVKSSKVQYNDAIDVRARSQVEVNDLLQRKHSWTAQDLDRFTLLYKDDSLNVKREEDAKKRLQEAEAREEQLSDGLYRAILTRYHEEQIWSDKIRRTSTWGTFILMGMNIFLFLVFQLLLEPWKRRRLVGNFEDKVKKALDEQASLQSSRLTEMSDQISTTLDQRGMQAKNSSQETIEGSSTTKVIENDLKIPTRSLSEHQLKGFHFLSHSFDNLFMWAQIFLQKVYSMHRKAFQSPSTATTTFTVSEFYAYGMLFGSLGFMASWLL